MKTRKDLARYCRSLGYTTGAEIGVADGINAQTFFQEIPDLRLHCIDPWLQHPSSRENARYRLEPYRAYLMRSTSLEASRLFMDESLDFVIIDGDHRFEYAMQDILLWVPKVKHGGMVICHDYYHFRDSGVVEAVNTYTTIKRILLHLTLGDPQSDDDKMPTAWWIQP